MAGNLSHDIEDDVLNALFRGGSYSGGTVYVGVATAPIRSSDTLATIEEEDDSGYQRVTATFTAPSVVENRTVVRNDGPINIGTWNASGDKDVTYGFITDAQSGTSGNVLAWFQFVEPYSVEAGGAIQIADQSLEISLN